jgi:tetratricopeptide (TPR) repeat protein
VVPGTQAPGSTAGRNGGSTASAAGQQRPGQRVQPRPLGSNMISDEDLDPLTGRPRIGAGLTPRNGAATTRPGFRSSDTLSTRGLEDVPQSTLSSGARVKPLVSLVPPRENAPAGPLNSLLARAESLLKDGKYLDAAATYEQALVRQPENALALVGKAHAELGAGAYQSAAYDLKFVFTRNPQMTGVKYKMDTFIAPQRREFLMNDLTSLVLHNPEMANTAEFLLSYLYYQTDQQQKLNAELQKWGDREGHDTWQSVLKRAWLSDSSMPPRTEGGGPK